MRITGFIVFLILCHCQMITLGGNRTYLIRTVVIDPGHGGHDAGCLGSSGKEKHIALDVALKLGKLIEENYPEVRVLYTRKSDVFVELHERAGIANRAKADLFICIHANSGPPAAFGSETFVMGLHKTEENLAVSKRENASILLEKDYKTRYDGFDPNSPEAHIIFNLFQNIYMNQSLAFASKIQNEFEEYAGRFNRGVKQAGFLVLYRTSMPSVLIETGFLTNKADEKYLLSEKGQDDIAYSIFRAFKSYKVDMEGENIATQEPAGKPVSIPAKKSTSESKDTLPAKSTSVKNVPDSAEFVTKNAVDPLKPTKKDTLKIRTSDSNGRVTELKKDSVTAKVSDAKMPENLKDRKQQDAVTGTLFYTVQIGAAPKGSQQGIERYKIENVIERESEDGLNIRFTVGNFKTLNEALQRQTEMRNKGFKDAFVTPYYMGKRISLKEASAINAKN